MTYAPEMDVCCSTNEPMGIRKQAANVDMPVSSVTVALPPLKRKRVSGTMEEDEKTGNEPE